MKKKLKMHTINSCFIDVASRLGIGQKNSYDQIMVYKGIIVFKSNFIVKFFLCENMKRQFPGLRFLKQRFLLQGSTVQCRPITLLL